MRVFGAPTSPQVVSKYYFLGKQRVAMRQNGKLTYLHGDHLGSASLATDATGVTLSQQRYLPYGGLRWAQTGSVFPTDWQYTDQQRQSTHLTGIRTVEYYDYRARMYDPKVGRFISPDSVVPDEKNPQTWNRFAYVIENPLKFVDPTGHGNETPQPDPVCTPQPSTPQPGPVPTPPNTTTEPQDPEQNEDNKQNCREKCETWLEEIQEEQCSWVAPTISGVIGAAIGIISAGTTGGIVGGGVGNGAAAPLQRVCSWIASQIRRESCKMVCD